METPDRCAAVSWIVTLSGVKGIVVNFYFQHQGADENTLVCHVINHLSHVLSVAKEDAFIFLTLKFPLDMDADLVKTLLKPYIGVNERSKFYDYETGVMIGEPLKPTSRL